MNLADLDRDLAEGRFLPVYLFFGQEHLIKERYVRRVADLVAEGMRDFNLEFVLAAESGPGDVLELANTLPFLGPPRVIVVRGLDSWSSDQLAVMERYLESPNESTCLVLVADKPDQRQRFFKQIKKLGFGVAFDPPKGKALACWLQDNAQRRGQDMSEKAAFLLMNRLGSDLMELDQELEKISLFALGRKRIEPDDVLAVSRIGPTANVFELGDAVGRQQPGPALEALKDLLDKDHHMPVLYMLIRHFRLLLKARVLMDRGGKDGEAASVLGLPPFVAKNYMNQARNLSPEDIKKGLALLLEANRTLVTTSAPERIVMDRLVLKLASLRPRRRPGP